MQQVQWTSFGVSSAITKTVLHFFPLAASTSAPYPVMVSLDVFAKDFPRKNLVIEGGRLGQPDGFRLEEAIPTLTESLPGFVGLQIELSSPQPRLDLSSSCCIIEIVSTAQSVKFAPLPMAESAKRIAQEAAAPEAQSKLVSLPLLHDAYGVCSLLVVNAGEETARPKLSSPLINGDNFKVDPIVSADVAPGTVAELALPEHLFQEQQPQEVNWGLMRGRVALFERSTRPDLCYYVLYRENVTKRIVSAVAL